MYLNMQKEVTRAARPSLQENMNKGQQLGDGSAPVASPLKMLLKNKACVTSREDILACILLEVEINNIYPDSFISYPEWK